MPLYLYLYLCFCLTIPLNLVFPEPMLRPFVKVPIEKPLGAAASPTKGNVKRIFGKTKERRPYFIHKNNWCASGEFWLAWTWCQIHKIIWQSIWSKLASWTYSGITFFLFGALPSDTLKIKHTKKLKETPSRDALENLPEKACMYAFIHLKLISNLQGFCQYIMIDMLNLIIADYRKYSAVAFLGP